jgi:transposase
MAKNEKKHQIQSKYNRTFSDEFKRSKVKDIEKGLLDIRGLCKEYGLSRTSVYNWLYLYGESQKGIKTVAQMESEQHKTELLRQKVAEYERIIGQKQLQIDFLERGYEIASEDLGFDLKKSTRSNNRMVQKATRPT